MRTTQHSGETGQTPEGLNSHESERDYDPEELWHDLAVTPEELIELDPLDISSEMVEFAEHPELADPVLRFLTR